jgi:hypothetical protein
VSNPAKSAFKSLSREQQALVNDRRVTGQYSPDEWLAFLNPVAEFDRQADEIRQGGGGFFARRYAKKHDMPNGLRSFAIPLLPILREDHDPDKPLELTIDLTGAKQKSKEMGKGEPYSRGRYYRIVDTFYDDPWLQGRARFADGADVRFAVIDHVRESHKRKKSMSGKTKFKTRSKRKTELAVEISFPARNYGAASEPATPTATAVKKESVNPGEDRTVVKLTRVVEPERFDEPPRLEHLLELIGAAYARVDPRRRKKL